MVATRRSYDHPHPDCEHVMRCYRKHILGCKRKWGTARGLMHYRAIVQTYLGAKSNLMENRMLNSDVRSSIPTVAEAVASAPLWLREAASKGQNCIRCRSALITCTGSVPDGVHLNAQYVCQSCHAEWEGD